MVNEKQNQQIELLSKIALRGGHYPWASVPISDSGGEDSQFYISNPQEEFRREALNAARRRNELFLVETATESGPRNALAGDRIIALLDRMIKRKRKSRDDDEVKRDRAVHERERHVTSDKRLMAMDVSPILPLDQEILQSWNGWLHQNVNQFDARLTPHRERLKEFLSTRGAKRFRELSWEDKTTLRQIVERLVQAEELKG